MVPFLIWRGTKRVILGEDISHVENIEIYGEVLGATLEERSEEHSTQTVFYRTPDGRIVVHRVHWSRWDETTVANVFVFSSLNEAEAMFWPELRQAGLIR